MQLVMKSRIHTTYSHKTQATLCGTEFEMERLVRLGLALKTDLGNPEYDWQEENMEGPLLFQFTRDF